MAEKQECEYCGKEAIGVQGLGCSVAYVCQDHVDILLLVFKPGKQVYGEYYFELFDTPVH